MEPIYKVGQVVTHKASGELAVVERAVYLCTKHTGIQQMTTEHLLGKTCEWEFADQYELSLGFDRDSVIVDGILIEDDDDIDDSDDTAAERGARVPVGQVFKTPAHDELDRHFGIFKKD